MPNLLFWNVKDATRPEVWQGAIPALANPASYDIDIMLFAELGGCENTDEGLSGYDLIADSMGFEWSTPNGYIADERSNELTDKVWLWHKNQDIKFKDRMHRCTAFEWNLMGQTLQTILLVGVHLPDARNHSEQARQQYTVLVNKWIDDLEAQYDPAEITTLVIGDFNMAPYDFGMTSHLGFNATPDQWKYKYPHQTDKRVWQKTARRVFINPMWKFLGESLSLKAGELPTRLPGTVVGGFSNEALHWAMFDQVLYRPTLYKTYPNVDVQIVWQISGLQRNLVSTESFKLLGTSDHLPLLLKLNH